MASAENVFYRPNDEGKRSKASAAHARFGSHEGDLPSLRSIYNAWRKEAAYVPSGPGAAKKYKQTSSSKMSSKLPHPEWCMRNFINARSMARAHDVRTQVRFRATTCTVDDFVRKIYLPTQTQFLMPLTLCSLLLSVFVADRGYMQG